MKHTFNLFSAAVVLALIATALGITPAFAFPAIIVNTTADKIAIDGHCSLREAILNINSGGQLHSSAGECTSGSGITNIGFDNALKGKTITLHSNLPPLNTNMNITGFNSPTTVTISGAGSHRAFFVSSGVSVTLSYLTFTKGVAKGGTGTSAGAIYTAGTLTVLNSTFTGNKAANGGAIMESGVGSGASAALTVENSTFSGNTATTDGGAIYIAGGYGGTATTSITNSTFTGNKATSTGGAIMQYADTGSSLLLMSDTISGNAAGLSSGGLYEHDGLLNVINTIIANSTSGGDCDANSLGVWNGNNLVGGNSCFSGAPGELTGDPILGPLAINSGSTKTMLPASNSPVIGAGSNTFCAATGVDNLDQRGQTRPFGTTCDIGAVEYFPVQYVTNSSFETNSGQFSIPNNWLAVNFNLNPDGIDTGIAEDGTAAVTINGETGKTKTLSQTRLVGSPAANWFNLSYWVKGQAVPLTGICQVQAAMYDGGSLKMTKFMACPTGTYSFSHQTVSFWTTTPITLAVVTIKYSKPSGQAWFDEITLSQ